MGIPRSGNSRIVPWRMRSFATKLNLEPSSIGIDMVFDLRWAWLQSAGMVGNAVDRSRGLAGGLTHLGLSQANFHNEIIPNAIEIPVRCLLHEEGHWREL